MKTSVHHTLDKEQANLLKKLDAWLMVIGCGIRDEKMVMKLRELITKIEEQGYYDTPTKELLNELRYQYMKNTKEESE